MTFLMGLMIGGSTSALLVFVLFSTKVWARGVAHGHAEAARELDTACRTLTKRVDDLELLRIAREPVPEWFLQKAQTEVLEWAESLVRQLKKQSGSKSSTAPEKAPSSSQFEKIQPL